MFTDCDAKSSPSSEEEEEVSDGLFNLKYLKSVEQKSSCLFLFC